MPEKRTEISRAELIAAASRRILDDPRQLEPDQRHQATVLLADLYATGLRHGITAEHWALVASLGTEVIDAIRARDRAVDAACRRRQTSDAKPRSKDRPMVLPPPPARTLDDQPLQAPGRSFRPPSPPQGRSGRSR